MKKIVIDARESGTSTGRYIDKLIENLHQIKPKYKITILTKPKRLEAVRKLAPGFEVQPTVIKEFTFAEQFGLLSKIRSLQPDLVFFPAAQQPILYSGKVITTIQDLTTARFRNPAKNWLVFTIKQSVYKFVTKRVARKSVELITPTEFVKEDIARFAKVNSRKITVTYEAADKITDKPEAVEDLVNKQFIMYIGRPLPHKNLDGLIQAFKSLRQKYPQLHLVLAGKKDDLYYLYQKRVESEGIKNVLFTGFVSEGQLRWLYENTAAYVFPSFSEGFGLPGLEAMAHGAPVVSSNATCLPEVYKDAAIYFDPKNIEDMTEKIELLLTDSKLCKKLVERGHKISKQYSWERMARQTLEVFDRALGA